VRRHLEHVWKDPLAPASPVAALHRQIEGLQFTIDGMDLVGASGSPVRGEAIVDWSGDGDGLVRIAGRAHPGGPGGRSRPATRARRGSRVRDGSS
jgi:hypothetical protein